MKTEHIAMDVNDVVGLFTASIPKSIETKNTSHGDNDFREALLVDLGNEKIVIKLSSNGFTDEKHLVLWDRNTTAGVRLDRAKAVKEYGRSCSRHTLIVVTDVQNILIFIYIFHDVFGIIC